MPSFQQQNCKKCLRASKNRAWRGKVIIRNRRKRILQILVLSDRKFKSTMINMLRASRNSCILLKLKSIELVMPSNHLILCHAFLLLASILPRIRVFSNELVLHIRLPSIAASASSLALPVNIQDWFPLGLTGWISLEFKGRVFNITVQKHQFFCAQPSLWSNSHIHIWLLEKP